MDQSGFQPSSPDEIKTTMLAEMREIIGDVDIAMIAELAALFVDDIPPQLNAAEQAIVAGDASRLRNIAHTLKGSSSSMGITRFAMLCYDLEQLAHDGQLLHAPDKLTQIWEEYQAASVALQAYL